MSRPPAFAGTTMLAPDAEPISGRSPEAARRAVEAADRRHLRALALHHGPEPLTAAGWVALKQ